MLSEDDIVAYAPDPESVRQTVRAAMEDALQSQQTSQTHSMSPAFESAGQANGAAGIEGVAATLRRIASTSEEQLAIDREMRQALDRQAQDMSELNDRIANEILSRSAPHRESEDQNGDSSIDSGSTRPVKSSRELQEEMLEIQRQQLELAKNDRAERDRASKESKAKKSSDDAKKKEKEQRERQSDSRAIKDTSQILSNLGLSGPASVVGQFGARYERMQKAANTLRSLGTSLQSNDVPARLALRAAAMGVDPHELRARESDNATEMAEQHTEAVQYESRLNEEARRRGIDPNELRARESDNARRMREEALNRGTVPMHEADGSLGAAAGDVSNRAEEAQRIQEQYAQQQAASDAQPRPTSVSGAQRATSSPSSKAAKTSKNEENAEQNSTLGSKVAGALEDAAGDVISDKISSSVAGKAAASGAGKVGGEAAEAVGTKVAGKAAGEAAEDVAGAAIGKAAASGAGKAIGGGAAAKVAGGALTKLAGLAGGPAGWVLTAASLVPDLIHAGFDMQSKGSLQGGGFQEGLNYQAQDWGQDLLHFLGAPNSGKDLANYRRTTSAMNFDLNSDQASTMMDVQKWGKVNGIDPAMAAQLTQNMVRFGATTDEARSALESLKENAHDAGIDLKEYAQNVGSLQNIANAGGVDSQQALQLSEETINEVQDEFGEGYTDAQGNKIGIKQIVSVLSTRTGQLAAERALGNDWTPVYGTNQGFKSLVSALMKRDLIPQVMRDAQSLEASAWGVGMWDSEEKNQAAFNASSSNIGLEPGNSNAAWDNFRQNQLGSDSYVSEYQSDTDSQEAVAEAYKEAYRKVWSQPMNQADVMRQGLSGILGTDQPFMGQVNINVTSDEGKISTDVSKDLKRTNAYNGGTSPLNVLNNGESLP